MALSEKQIFQTIIAVASLVPLSAGIAGVLLGPSFVGGDSAAGNDLPSHFRYLSGVLVGIWLGFVTCIPRIEKMGARFRTLAIVVFMGGCARLYSLFIDGEPSIGHYLAIGMEMGAVPLLALWQVRIARKAEQSAAGNQDGTGGNQGDTGPAAG